MAAELNEVPEKLFYKIGEVCQYTDTQPYVLRFWESEFPQLAPEKNRSGQRVYRRDDIELIFRIKKLLYEEEYTIAGARRRLEQEIAGLALEDQPGDRAPEGAPALSEEALSEAAKSRKGARRLPLEELLPDEPHRRSSATVAAPAANDVPARTAPSPDEVEPLRREVHELTAALARAQKSAEEAESARLAAEQGRLAADEARRTAEDQRDALRAKLRRAAARVDEALAHLGPDDTAS